MALGSLGQKDVEIDDPKKRGLRLFRAEAIFLRQLVEIDDPKKRGLRLDLRRKLTHGASVEIDDPKKRGLRRCHARP